MKVVSDGEMLTNTISITDKGEPKIDKNTKVIKKNVEQWGESVEIGTVGFYAIKEGKDGKDQYVIQSSEDMIEYTLNKSQATVFESQEEVIDIITQLDLIEGNMEIRNFNDWKTQASELGYVVKKPITIKDGESNVNEYSAQDKQGNHKGSFDTKTNIGTLTESNQSAQHQVFQITVENSSKDTINESELDVESQMSADDWKAKIYELYPTWIS